MTEDHSAARSDDGAAADRADGELTASEHAARAIGLVRGIDRGSRRKADLAAIRAAREHLEAARRLAPDAPDTLRAIARVETARGRTAQALRAQEDAARLDPQDRELAADLAVSRAVVALKDTTNRRARLAILTDAFRAHPQSRAVADLFDRELWAWLSRAVWTAIVPAGAVGLALVFLPASWARPAVGIAVSWLLLAIGWLVWRIARLEPLTRARLGTDMRRRGPMGCLDLIVLLLATMLYLPFVFPHGEALVCNLILFFFLVGLVAAFGGLAPKWRGAVAPASARSDRP